MHPFYQKLARFGRLVNITSREKNMDIASYFTVVHPAHPVFNDADVKPDIQFAEQCPRAVKREVIILWQQVFDRPAA